MRSKRRTPSAPMAALGVDNVEDETTPTVDHPTTMDARTRDEFLLKTLARIERIDTEVELLTTAVQDHTIVIEAVRHDFRLLNTEVATLNSNMETVKKLLTELLAK